MALSADVAPSNLAAGRLVWSVGGLVRALADALDSRFSVCVVRGELSGYSRAASGHSYFVLKDAEGAAASLRCTLFRRNAFLVGFQPADGQRVELRGRVSVYEARGEVQFIVESMQLAGEGALLEQLLRLKQKLARDGLFDANRKRALPLHPRAVGVVTSLAAAALHDVCSTLGRRSPHVRIVVYPTAVQGADAPPEIVDALRTACRRDEVDVLILCRGGGSLEDLWAFNDERVVRAVAGSTLPIVCGVGHETDVTLVDHAADQRAATPTAAAELVAPATQDCLRSIATLAAALRRRGRRHLDDQAQRLDVIAARALRPAALVGQERERLDALRRDWLRRPAAQLERRTLALQRLAIRLAGATRTTLPVHAHRLQSAGHRLASVDPRRVLERGYAWLSDDAGHALTCVADVATAVTVTATLRDGQVRLESPGFPLGAGESLPT